MAESLIGNICKKIAGRESNKIAIIVDKIDSNYVTIDGNLRRKKCNILHLELLNKKLDIKKGASTEEVHKAMEKEGIKTVKRKPKKETSSPRPRKIRKTKKKVETVKKNVKGTK